MKYDALLNLYRFLNVAKRFFATRWKFQRRSPLPMIYQTESAECGLACITMLLAAHGAYLDLSLVRERFPASIRGVTARRIIEIGNAYGLDGRTLALPSAAIGHLQLPAILHWDRCHFVVLVNVDGNYATIHDPAHGRRRLSIATLNSHFSGMAIELLPGPKFQREDRRLQYSAGQLMKGVGSMRRELTSIFCLGLATELLASAPAILVQHLLDQVAAANASIIVPITLGCGVVYVLRAGSTLARAHLITALSTRVSFEWLSTVFAHFLKLPQHYFDSRHVGDIVSRFGSITTIQRGINSAGTQGFVDGLLIIGCLTTMAYYSPLLTALSLSTSAVYLLYRLYVNSAVQAAITEQMVFSAHQQTHFYETAKGIQSIRLYDRGSERMTSWLQKLTEQYAAENDLQKHYNRQLAVAALITGIDRAAIFGLGVSAMVNHALSIGALFAFVACRDQFSVRMTSLIDKFFELKTLRLHADRVADIVMTPAEPSWPESTAWTEKATKLDSLKVQNVTFRYAPSEDAVLDGLSLHINAGECVAITGPSGCGKTTLVKLILGLVNPEQGELEFGGVPIENIPLPFLRSTVAVVMQDDTLFSGTILENISFFASAPDTELAKECARLAAIDNEITAMPMGYDSLIGGNGNGLSGGQRQRILLARALYRRPSVLILDEATSHLDAANEILVSDAVRALNITRIIIAHREETIERADRVIRLDKGRVSSVYSEPHQSVQNSLDQTKHGRADRDISAYQLEKA